MKMAENQTSPGSAEMAAAKTLTTKVLAIGTWTAKATPKTIPPIMPSEAYDTMRLMLAGKIDQWFAKIDGSWYFAERKLILDWSETRTISATAAA